MGRKRWKVGDRVEWRDRRGELRVGHVKRVAVSPGHTKGLGPYEATKLDPCYHVVDDRTGERTVHHKHDFLNG